MPNHITGASAWEQGLFDRLAFHVDNERELIDEYRELTTSTSVPGFHYLAELILADEERHHRTFADLAETIRTEAECRSGDSPVPPITVVNLSEDERRRILALTDRFLAHERADARDLQRLAKELKPVRDITLWQLLVRLMQADTNKHIEILRFIRDRVKHPAL